MAIPLLGAAALSFAPSLFGGFFGRRDPTERLRQQAMGLFTPQNIGANTNQFYQQFLNSPMFAQAQAGAAGRQNQLQSALGQSLGARGLGSSGVGAIAPALASTAAGRELTDVRSQGFQNAQAQAMQALMQQLNAMTGLGVPRNMPAELFGGGLDAFSKLLLQRFAPQPGGGGGGPDPTAGWGGFPWAPLPPTR